MTAYTINIYASDFVWHVFIAILFYALGYVTAAVMRP